MSFELTLIDNRNETDPRLNLALEEFVFRNYGEGEYLLLYVNEASVILGKHQNVLEEIDQDYAEKHGIPIVRRISGGGAVYHDPGNLNFSVITGHDPKKHNNYESFLAPVVAALRELGIETRLNNRNSLVLADGRKVSGNAQFTSRGRMLSHGTLLFNSDLDALNAVLRPIGGEIESHAVQSVRSRVVNLAELMRGPMSMPEFRDHIARHYTGSDLAAEKVSIRRLSDDEWCEVRRLAEEKYDSWEWNIGRSPKFTVRHRVEKGGKEFPLSIHVVDGVIDAVEFESPTNDSRLASLAASLRGERYEPKRVRAFINIIESEERLL